MDDFDYNRNDEIDTLQSDNDDNEDEDGTDTSMHTIRAEVSRKSRAVTLGNQVVKIICGFCLQYPRRPSAFFLRCLMKTRSSTAQLFYIHYLRVKQLDILFLPKIYA
ncbi:hypothetical protein INT47_002160 [Mucor saturninus]|uniref:Uncharacterized protein n=1 Tax=Mucor saturninus TaxID=64648 RepID=A0A8H7R0R0_9FUNG|nr:hypothetical protein INT47_002160 [Mucor saturninus]